MTAAPVRAGLWGHAALTAAPPRARIVSLVALIMLGYSVAMLITSAASKFLTPRFAAPPRGGAGGDALAGLGLVVHVLDPVFLLAALRACAAAALCAILRARGDAPAAPPPLGAPALRTAVLVGVCNAAGYAPYLALTARGGVSLWSALIGLYVVGPVVYGVAARGEARSPRKLAGIAVCIAAGVVLGVTEEEGVSSGAGGALQVQNAALFFAAAGVWGVCDGLAAFVGRDLHVLYVAGGGGVGFAAVALAAAGASYAATAGAAPGALAAPPPPPPGALPPSAGVALLALAQCAGVGAWFFSVRLGTLSEASAFLPVTSLYTMVASLAAMAIFAERPPPLYWLGMPLATVGIALIAFADAGAPSGGAALAAAAGSSGSVDDAALDAAAAAGSSESVDGAALGARGASAHSQP
jgi:drug/metabolite transporter (DMT)-like permease